VIVCGDAGKCPTKPNLTTPDFVGELPCRTNSVSDKFRLPSVRFHEWVTYQAAFGSSASTPSLSFPREIHAIGRAENIRRHCVWRQRFSVLAQFPCTLRRASSSIVRLFQEVDRFNLPRYGRSSTLSSASSLVIRSIFVNEFTKLKLCFSVQHMPKRGENTSAEGIAPKMP